MNNIKHTPNEELKAEVSEHIMSYQLKVGQLQDELTKSISPFTGSNIDDLMVMYNTLNDSKGLDGRVKYSLLGKISRKVVDFLIEEHNH